MVRLPWNQKQTYRLNSKASNVTIGFDLVHDLDLELSTSNMEFPISQPKVVLLLRNEKQTYGLNSRPQMWPMGLNLTITVTFEFWRSNLTLTFDLTHDLDHGFSWSNFEIAVSQNGRLDWHCTKEVAVGKLTNSILCKHFEPLSWVQYQLFFKSLSTGNVILIAITQTTIQGALLLTWFNFNPVMDK